MTPSQALAELQAAINIYHFVSKEAKAVLKAIHEGQHDPVEKSTIDKVNIVVPKDQAAKVEKK